MQLKRERLVLLIKSVLGLENNEEKSIGIVMR